MRFPALVVRDRRDEIRDGVRAAPVRARMRRHVVRFGLVDWRRGGLLHPQLESGEHS